MIISKDLARQIITAGMPDKKTQKINEVGGSVCCKDSVGKWFDLEWFHGDTVTTLANIETSRHIFIGESERDIITL